MRAMQSYVHHRDVAVNTRRATQSDSKTRASRGQQYDDLKQEPTDPDNIKPQELQASERLDKDTLVTHHDRDNPFYLTDPSSLSGTSSVENGAAEQDDRKTFKDPPNAVDGNGIKHRLNSQFKLGDTYGEAQKPVFSWSAATKPTSAASEAHNLMSTGFGPPNTDRRGIADKYVSGDSLPDTTSGRLSTVGGDDVYENNRGTNHPEQNHISQNTPLQQQHFVLTSPRDSHSRAVVAPTSTVHFVSGAVDEQISHVNPPEYIGNPADRFQHFNTHQTPHVMVQATQNAEGFRYGPSPSIQKVAPNNIYATPAVLHSQHLLPQRGAETSSQQQYDKDRMRSAQAVQQMKTIGQQKALKEIESFYNEHNAKKHPRASVSDQPPAQTFVAEPQQAKLPPVETSLVILEAPQQLPDQASYDGPQSSLGPDIDENELFRMDYETLKSQSFDLHRETAESSSAAGTSNAAQQRMDNDNDAAAAAAAAAAASADTLAHVTTMPPDEQARFFSSLQQEGWEEAGDWFIAQFSDLMTRLKAARHGQRSVARHFAQEVDRRHELVARARGHTEDALQEMKESAARVLQGTPKGKKTR